MQTNQTYKVPGYLTYPKEFTPYKAYKPILVALAAAGFYFLFLIILSIIWYTAAFVQGYDIQSLLTSGYDSFDAYSPLGAVMSLGSVALMLPSLLIGNRIVNARPFSSYSSSRGGFDFAVFAKCFAAALVIIALPLVLIEIFTSGERQAVRFTVLGFIFCTILVPLQCVAEEYVFRGHLMQMFGSWIKIPVIPIILQTILFAAMHPYNITGIITVALMGLILGFCAYFTNGLEAGCALHIVNNMVVFYLTGFGFGGVKTNVEVIDLVITGVLFCVYLAFIIFASKKLGWFSHIKKDAAAEFNAKIAAKKQPVK